MSDSKSAEDATSAAESAPTLATAISDVYQELLPEFFNQPFEPERRADCSNCTMCARGPVEPKGGRFFRPEVKCCTYHPKLPNYNLGALLANDEPGFDEGRRRIRAKIERRHGVTPQGIAAPPAFALLYEKVSETKGFGRAPSLRCPYYEETSGGCTIWPYREAICSTYFCKYDKGETGQTFWDRLKRYQVELQSTLITHALLELGWGVAELPRPQASVTAEELEGELPDPETYERIWGDWIDREEELFVKCHEIVSSLTPEDVERLGGIRLDVELRWLTESYDQLSDSRELPVLNRNPEMMVTPPDITGSHMVMAYCETDVSRVPKALMEALNEFDGKRSVEEVLEGLKAEKRPTPSESLVRSLMHHRILVEAD